MSRRALPVLLLTASCALRAAAPHSIEAQLTANERRLSEREAIAIIELLQGYHYSDRRFVEIDATELLDQFQTSLDPWRMTFTASDIAYIKRRFERSLKPVYLFKGDVHPAFEIYDLFAKRATARNRWIEARLARPFDLAGSRTFPISRKDAEWPADAAAADQLWEDRLKADLIAQRLRGLDEAAAVAEVRRKYEELRKRIDALDAYIVRERFIDTMLQLFDPHSGYFRHEAATEFGKELSTMSDGVGLAIETWHDRVFVRSIDPGSPADRDGRITIGDEIVSIAAIGAAPVPVKGLKERQVLALLSGEPETPVALNVRRRGADSLVEVIVTRAKFGATDYRARAALLRVTRTQGETPIGLVVIPTFYGPGSDSAAQTSASVSRDVAELIRKLNAAGAKGIVIDLGGNGGGLLTEAVKLTGLFILKGPVISVRGLDGKIQVSADEDDRIAYDGPLVILTSPASASASEAFAGALQHYRRALVVGGITTFGKGTSQGVIELERARQKEAGGSEWGLLRLTQQYFYLPNGKSTQQTGVLSDIPLPDGPNWAEYREASMRHAMPVQSIQPIGTDIGAATAGAAILDGRTLDFLKSASAKRIRTLPEFRLEARSARLEAGVATQKEVLLDLDKRRAELETLEKEAGALIQERRRLRTQLSYAMTAVDTDEVVEANRIHQNTLNRRLKSDREDRVWACDGRTVLLELAPHGQILEISADSWQYGAYLADADNLASAWTVAGGGPITADQMRTLLRALQYYADTRTPEEDIRDVFRRIAPQGADERQIESGMEGVFRGMVTLDPPGTSGTPRFDVCRREALRLAADWVQSTATPASARQTRP